MESNKKEMERVVVRRGSSHLISHHVDTPGSILRCDFIYYYDVFQLRFFFHCVNRWDFMSTDHDIGYGWYRKSEDGKKDVEVVCNISDTVLVHACRRPFMQLLYRCQ